MTHTQLNITSVYVKQALLVSDSHETLRVERNPDVVAHDP